MASELFDSVQAELPGFGVRIVKDSEFTITAMKYCKEVANTRAISIVDFQGTIYISTYTPAGYLVPQNSAIVDLVNECLVHPQFKMFAVPAELVEKYSLRQISDELFDKIGNHYEACRNIATAVVPYPLVDAGPTANYATEGVHAQLRDHGIFIVREGEKLLALRAICTHEGCRGLLTVVRGPSFFCPNDASVFDAAGKVKAGPVVRDLPRLQAATDERGHLLVSIHEIGE